jgi:hypothetical protein
MSFERNAIQPAKAGSDGGIVGAQVLPFLDWTHSAGDSAKVASAPSPLDKPPPGGIPVGRPFFNQNGQLGGFDFNGPPLEVAKKADENTFRFT